MGKPDFLKNLKKIKDNKPAIWQTAQYSVYPDRVEQQEFTGQAISTTELTSNYKSQLNDFLNPKIIFKFSINGHDNEMPYGVDHQFTCIAPNGICETPLITFGEQLKNAPHIPVNTYLTPNTKCRIRLDFRPVLHAFNTQGYYTTFKGERIYKADFKSVFVAGDRAPLTWDFGNLVNFKNLELTDSDNTGIYEVTLLLNPDQEDTVTATNWKLSRNIAAFPQYTSDFCLTTALYNLALEEMVNAVEPDNTFRTGKEWAGVWTRDISYSIILSMAMLQPRVAQNSLVRKVNQHKRIIQDTGTGGAYPVSSDRIIWVVAAWELYTVTGDANWLKEAYQISRNTLDDDLKNGFNSETGLFRGESSFLDWREQTYPAWMQPADIYESECLSTNAVFYRATCILAQMAELMNDAPAVTKYREIAEKIKKGINQYLWLPDKKYYGQFLYGRHFKTVSPKADALGEALSVLFEVASAEQQQAIMAHTPVSPFGISCIYPQISNIPPYHNNGIWPFVQSYWALAAAKVGNETALTESMCAIYRPAALLLTNKENFVASNGDYAGTQINSDNMLWSLAGCLSLTYKIIFGLDFQKDKLIFKPVVPEAFKGNHQLTNFKYRQAILNIYVNGFGNQIKTITLNNNPLSAAEIPASLKGQHDVRIELANNSFSDAKINKVPVEFSPVTPVVSYHDGVLTWQAVEDAALYQVLKNGKLVRTTKNTQEPVDAGAFAEFQVIAVNVKGHESFASEPVTVASGKVTHIYQLEPRITETDWLDKDFTGNSFVEISRLKNKNLKINAWVPETGIYTLDFWYANGEGPVNTSNKCAFRTLKKDNARLGIIVLPQRGFNDWSDWGFTNAVTVKLQTGMHHFSLVFEPNNENMHGEINRALLDYLRLTKISD